MHVRFWGTRGSIPTPGNRTTIFGGNTSCVEIRTNDQTTLILDCGTGIRELGLDILRRPKPHRIHLLIGHTHWDHIQGFPFFAPAFVAGTELNIYGSSAFQRSLEDSLSGQMQYSYFPVKLHDLASRLHYTELEEGFFRIGGVLVQTQYLNHTAPTIAYRITSDGATAVYVTDHEPFWNAPGAGIHHPGDQRHVEFLNGADLVIHDAQYTTEEYRTKLGWGHSTAQYATDVAAAAGVARLALFHHDPTHDDDAIRRMEQEQRARVAAIGSSLDVFSAAESMELELVGNGRKWPVAEYSALGRRPISGCRVMVVTDHPADIAAIEHVLADEELVTTSASDGRTALALAARASPDLVIIDSSLLDVGAASVVQSLRTLVEKPELPVLVLTEESEGADALHNAETTAMDYVARPFSPPMLRTRVRAWLSRTLPIAASPVRPVFSEPPKIQMPMPPHPVQQVLTHNVSLGTLVELLASVPLFSTSTPEQLGKLASHAAEHSYLSGHVIIRQDDSAIAAYATISGRVRVLETVPDSLVEKFVAELGPGEIFGELGVLRDRPRSATVITIEPTRCVAIPAEDFLSVLEDSKEMCLSLLRVVAGRLYDAHRLLGRHAPDALTGLPGRRAFHELYRRLAADARRRESSILMLVVDVLHLKEINDRYGYSVGDNVLRTVADALVESSRDTDLVARCGADEFAVLLLEATEKDAETIINRVRQKCHTLAIYRGLPLAVECRMGFCVTAEPPDTAEELIRLADENMQQQRSRRAT
jgi:diguanylate cyclase (GGDEF)-like protein